MGTYYCGPGGAYSIMSLNASFIISLEELFNIYSLGANYCWYSPIGAFNYKLSKWSPKTKYNESVS